jgi:hypothetical protein
LKENECGDSVFEMISKLLVFDQKARPSACELIRHHCVWVALKIRERGNNAFLLFWFF